MKHVAHRGPHLAACGLLAIAVAVAGCSSPVAVATIGHRGLEGCVELRAGGTRVVVAPSWAGRLSVLDFGWGNVLAHDPKVDGKVVEPEVAWAPWDGNATDVLGSDGRHQWPRLWLHPWPAVEFLPGGVEVTSTVNRETQLSLTKRYELSPDGRALTYAVTVACHGGRRAQAWTVWERAMMAMPEGSYAIVPVARSKAFPDGWRVQEKSVVDPPDRAVAHGEFLVLRAGTKKGAGLAARLRAGWLGVVRGRHVLLMTFPLEESGHHTHHGGAHALFWLAEGAIEMEPLSAEDRLRHLESLTFTQVWHALDLPDDVPSDSPAAVGAWLDAQTLSAAR